MRRLIVIALAIAFAAGVTAPGAWAQGTAAPTKAAEPKAGAAATPTKPAEPAKAPEKKGPKVDINAASAADLQGAGLSADEAKKVIDGRPYKRKDELVQKNIVSKETYAKVKDGIIAHQVKTETKKK